MSMINGTKFSHKRIGLGLIRTVGYRYCVERACKVYQGESLTDDGNEMLLAPWPRLLQDPNDRVRLQAIKAMCAINYQESESLVFPNWWI
jgi:hypothetical protein